MARKTIKVPPLILGGILVIVLISVTAVIAFRHFQAPIKSIIHKDIIQQESEATLQDKTTASIADSISSSIPSEYEKPEKSSSAREEIASVRHENDDVLYIYLSSDSNSLSEYRGGDNQRNRIVSKTTQKVGTTTQSPIPKSSPDSSTDTTLTSKSTDYIPQNNSLQSWESGNNSSAWDDESYQEEKEALNYNVSVSRDFISGSFVEGKINVVLSIYVDTDSPNGLIVKEYVPRGWDVVESTPSYKNFNPSTGEIKWLFIGSDVGSMEINYTVVKREDSADRLLFRGNYLYNNPKGEHIAMQIDGANGV